ncbi:DNA cytosine methyltransferase [Phenylobacterium sp.]|uniref:DNA cytosine methyltransferase n=1 Tax=Phenylobacterium sp. TaxID=1871053 RepID=UPI0025FFE772|nr:DNA cytosine methyltransferase [Phenylobacterium sp.]MBX3482519.1 DNA cytosine methyltransferase [Phenylobacterium sp.]
MAELVERSQVARLREKSKAFEALRRKARRASEKPRSVVGFAGGGGSSVAWKMATGWDPDVAMNHWMTAVCAHQRHFPQTEHHCADIFDVDPRSVLPGEPIAFAWFSPDCTDFSKAKGAAPKSERIRGLLWSILPWVATRRPDVIMIENVEEFEQAGPVYRRPDDWRAVGADGVLVPGEAGQPIQARRGETFRSFVAKLRRVGGVVEWRVINAADYGAPTTRKRLYVIVRFDGRPIVWPERTHAPRKDCARLGLKPWVGAHTIIDWGQDCPSIFLDEGEVDDLAKRTGKRVKRPLVAATQKRIARGMERYVIGSADPFLVNISQRNWGGDRAHGVRDTPVPTLTSSKGGEYALVDPAVANVVKFQENSTFTDPRDPIHTIMAGATRHGLVTSHLASVAHGAEERAWPVDDPARTQTGHHDKALVTANLVGLAHGEHGERPGSRTRDLHDPAGHVHAGGGDGALVAGSLVRTNFHSAAARNGVRDPEEPMATNTGDGGVALTAATLVPRYGERERQAPRAQDVGDPLPTIVPDANGGQVAAATLLRQFGTSSARDLNDPHPTVMTEGDGGKSGLIAASLSRQFGGSHGADVGDPAPTVMPGGSGKTQVVAAHLDAYYGCEAERGNDIGEPARTSTGKDRLSLVATWLEQANTGAVGHDQREPVSTIVAGGGEGSGWGPTQRLIEARLELDGGPVGRRGAVLDFLWRHFGVPTQAEWDDPAATLQGRLKFGLVLLPRRPSAGTTEDTEGAHGARHTEGRGVSGDGPAASETSVRGAGEAGVPCSPQSGRSVVADFDVWMIVDIGLRMLTPRELAAAMGLPADYDLSLDHLGRPISKTHQTQMIGNMVSPPPAAALIAANCPDLIQPGWRMAA